MKKISILLLVIVAFLGSCQQDFLELTPQDKLNSGDVWKDPKLIELVINEMYQSMPDGFSRGWYMLGAATDDGENSYGWPSGQSFNRGDYGPSNYPMGGTWFSSYQMIRQANLFFDNIDAVEDIDADVKDRMVGEVHFLRAFYYFDLMRHYGGVPILDRALSLDDDFSIPRNTKEEVIAFIINDLDAAASLLPTTHGSSLLGKANKGAANALKGRTLLYAEKWAESASASKLVIDSGVYSLFSDYHSLFHAANDNNEEVVFDKQFQEPELQHWGHLFNHPVGYSGGWGGTGPTQELVDAYEMIDGKSIDDSPLYNPATPYANRDPRLSATVFYDGSMWRGRAVETRIGGLDGMEKNGDATKTGYYMKKFLDESFTDWANLGGSNNWIHIRYAEVLLNYAEAQNEASGPDDSVYDAVNQVRARASVNMPPLPDGLSKDQMRDRIRNERRIELAFEEHRFFDLRRWGLGDLLNRPIHGMRIGPNGELTGADAQGKPYGRIEVETRTFDQKNYLAPIPQSEIDKLGSDVLQQNPGY
ncbi:RagB/SusD family nutrient uptake outer membrane protein [Aureibaculum sp. 2210JD6-5]|uniref:RagB/SusD family nutrient uptake outer membrane protein n=1 Tax=Aureibaculum sp. 2210JD6-5 TaxID=3103957 RepID=UPI002AACDCBB|nr:RagB/SusD family nutrient uptake outer membrane protein [Aureibaculum sp. 2210JD6-5]MDY7397021.1 RagB/SusD family nutrient uptake outer membrane protein [Aureibaculum sp. 2210JD6-5]